MLTSFPCDVFTVTAFTFRNLFSIEEVHISFPFLKGNSFSSNNPKSLSERNSVQILKAWKALHSLTVVVNIKFRGMKSAASQILSNEETEVSGIFRLP